MQFLCFTNVLPKYYVVCFRLVQHVLYCAESGCNIFSCLYNLSLYLIDLNRPFVIHFDFLYLCLWNLTILRLYVFIFSRFCYLIYKIIIEMCISIRALVHFAINV